MFAFLAHPEHLPRYGGPLWLSGDLEDRRGADARASRGPVPAGGEPLITLRGYFAGLPVEAVVRTAARAPHSLEITQVRGTLRGFSQWFKIETDEDGAVLTCRVEADPGIPMLSDEAAKHFLIQYVERMLDRLRLAAERRAPSRRPRPAAKEAATPGDADAEAADAAAEDAIASADAARDDRAAAEAGAGGAAVDGRAAVEPAANTGPAPRRPRRPFPQRRPRPQRFSAPQRPAGAPQSPETGGPPHDAATGDSHAQTPAGDASGQGPRRRRRRRRRGRGSAGGGSAGGPASGPADDS